MPTLETLTEKSLRGVLNTSSLRKARSYRSRVQNPTRQGETLLANVRGTSLYEVEIDVMEGGIQAACSCPYTWGGHCKHIGAVLLKWLESPTTFQALESKPIDSTMPIEVMPVEPPPTAPHPTPPQWLTTSFKDRLQTDREELAKWLDAIRLQDLRRTAKTRGWTIKGTKKADVIRQMIDPMTQPSDVLKITMALDGEHRQALCALVFLGGQENIQVDDIDHLAQSLGPLKQHKQIATYTRHLVERGLAIPAETQYSYLTDFVPRNIGRALPPLLDKAIPAADALETDQPASDLRFADPFDFVRGVNQLARLLEQAPVPLQPPMPRPRLEKFHPGLQEWNYDPYELRDAQASNKLQQHNKLALTVPPPPYHLPDEAIKKYAPLLGGEACLEFAYALLVATGFFQPGSPTSVVPDVKTQFLCQSELAQRTILAQTYFSCLSWQEIWDVLRQQDSLPANRRLKLRRDWRHRFLNPDRLASNLTDFRRFVLRVLAALPNEKWVLWQDFAAVMHKLWPTFDYTFWNRDWYGRKGDPGWFFTQGDSTKALNTNSEQGWEQAQGVFIRTILTGPLHWLGLTDLSFAGETLVAFRLQGLTDLYWDRVEILPAPKQTIPQLSDAAPPPSNGDTISPVATEDYTIIVNPTEINAQAHGFLDQIARLEVMEPNRFVYHLDPQAAHEAFESGATLTELEQDWVDLLRTPLPKTIGAKLAEWWAAYGQVRIYDDVTLIEFKDDYALAEMKAVTSLERYLVAEISPRLALVSPDAISLLAGELEKSGYTPKLSDEV